jgi:hypothetical protein
MYLYGSMVSTLGSSIDAGAYKLYLDRLLEEHGSPSDPTERMLLELLALAFHNTGRLSVRAANAPNVNEATAYNNATVKLLAECRRTALALKEYKTPAATKLSVVSRHESAKQAGAGA